jgi:hypothetical protein
MLRARISSLLGTTIVMAELFGFGASSAEAQVRPGVQGGVSIDPDQVYFGGHIETTPLVDRLRFRPSLDIGLGDDVTLVAFNFDFTYSFRETRPWNLYAGAGPAINWFDSDRDSETEGGFNFIIGAKNPSGLFFEMKIGVVDSPDLKFGVGYTFR